MISIFLGARQDPTPNPRQSFCNYLHSEIEHLEEGDFLTFRNETVKFLSEIQYKAKERKRQVTTSQEVTTYQLPEASQSTVGWEYILTILETQPVSIPIVQPQQTTTGQPVTVIAKVQHPSGPSASSAEPTSYVVEMTNSRGLPDRCFSTHLQLHLHNRRRVSTTLLDYPVSSP